MSSHPTLREFLSRLPVSSPPDSLCDPEPHVRHAELSGAGVAGVHLQYSRPVLLRPLDVAGRLPQGRDVAAVVQAVLHTALWGAERDTRQRRPGGVGGIGLLPSVLGNFGLRMR